MEPAKILVVEDEPLIRMVIVETLEDSGFSTEEAADAATALAMLSDIPGRFNAVILDLGLPDRRGNELAAELRSSLTDLPIVIASGQDKARLEQQFHSDPRVAVVSKPFTGDALCDALEGLGVKPPPQ